MKKMILAFLTIAAMAAGSADGADPTLVVIDGKLLKVDNVVQPRLTIVAPSTAVELGEIVKLEGKLDGDVPSFVKGKSYKWTITERGYAKQYWEQGNWVIFGTGVKPSTVRVVCEVTLTYKLEKEEITKKVESVVDLKVGSPDPTPPDPSPTPDPHPTPAPDFPGLTKNALDWANDVGPADKAKSAPVIAKALQSVAARIGNDPSLKTPSAILAATKAEINGGLTGAGFKPADWDKWGVLLQDWAYQQYQAGKLRTIDEYKTAWGEIATGLNAVK